MVRRQQWHRLEQLLELTTGRRIRKVKGEILLEMSDLYRSACADLAMAEQYRLSPETVTYLHALVGRAHNHIYRSGKFQIRHWHKVVFRDAPKQIFSDRCVHVCSAIFFGLFILSAYVTWDQRRFPGVGETLLGGDNIENLEEMYEQVDFTRPNDQKSGRLFMVAYYIQHNTGIGLTCFAKGPLVLAGIWETAYQATVLGASFGYMARPDARGGDSFLHFVTAHGPFELTAIVLAAASGLRIGMGWIYTHGLGRIASLRVQAISAIPIMSASGVLFILAALTEGLFSPSSIPYFFKAVYGMLSSTMLMYYFVILGYPSSEDLADGT